MRRTATGFPEQSLLRLGEALTSYSRRHDNTPECARNFNDAQRQKAARDGAALPDGSFPIYNSKDLRDAIDDSGRAGHPSEAREHIIRRAKALGLASELPQPWRDHGYA